MESFSVTYYETQHFISYNKEEDSLNCTILTDAQPLDGEQEHCFFCTIHSGKLKLKNFKTET